MTTETVIRKTIPEEHRADHTNRLFGIHFPLQLEPAIFNFASDLSADYTGGYWLFYKLANGGFSMAPDSERTFGIACRNGYRGQVSADALGIVCCLYAYSHLAFVSPKHMAEVYARHFHWLREWALEHREVGAILGAID